MLWVKRVYFWLALIALTVVFLIFSWPYVLFSALFSKNLPRAVRYGVWYYGRVFMALVRPVCAFHVKNPDRASALGPCIITPNHQSFLDIYLLGGQSAKDLCFVVGKWPFRKLFFFAFMMYKAEYIRVGRELDEFSFVESCSAALKQGATIVCFPEGTRSRDGGLQSFHSGIFRVAALTGAAIVPMVYHNTGKLCPRGTFAVNPQDVYISLLEAEKALPDLPVREAARELKERVHASMREALANFQPSSWRSS